MPVKENMKKGAAAVWHTISPARRPLNALAYGLMIGVAATELYSTFRSEDETNDVEGLYGLSGDWGRAATDLTMGAMSGAFTWFSHHAATSIGMRFRHAGAYQVLGESGPGPGFVRRTLTACCLMSRVPERRDVEMGNQTSEDDETKPLNTGGPGQHQ